MSGISLLLVEDNILNQKLVSIKLSKMGFKVEVVDNGKHAVDKVSDKTYDVILMDLMMPVMDGLEASEKIREIEKRKGDKNLIIGLTANTYDADREKCLQHGMDEYMTKPFDIDQFWNILENFGFKKSMV